MSKTLVVVKSCGSCATSPVPHHLSTTDSPPPSLQHHPSTSSSSQRPVHSTAVTSHYEDLASVATDWLPGDADAVTWETVTESGAHVTLPQSGVLFCLSRRLYTKCRQVLELSDDSTCREISPQHLPFLLRSLSVSQWWKCTFCPLSPLQCSG